MPLIPQVVSEGTDRVHPIQGNWTQSNIADFWNQNLLTGDNLREQPYNVLYPRLTTRSNTFRIHHRVQRIQKARSSDPEVFDPQVDLVIADLQGSTLVERYLDPTDETLPDPAPDPNAPSLEAWHRFRIIEHRNL